MLRWTFLACLVVGLVGCGAGNKGKANSSKPGGGDEQASPTYEWKRPPEDGPRSPPQPTKPGERKTF
jgi:hypothetical protein